MAAGWGSCQHKLSSLELQVIVDPWMCPLQSDLKHVYSLALSFSLALSPGPFWLCCLPPHGEVLFFFLREGVFCLFVFKAYLLSLICLFPWESLFGGRGGQRDRERMSSTLCTEPGARLRAPSQDPEIMTWARVRSWMLSPWSHPGTPLNKLFELQHIYREVHRS